MLRFFIAILASLLLASPAAAQQSKSTPNDNSSRKQNCRLAGGSTSDVDASSFVCNLSGDSGHATVNCSEGKSCWCTGTACKEFGGNDAIERLADGSAASLRVTLDSLKRAQIALARSAKRAGLMTKQEYNDFALQVRTLATRTDRVVARVKIGGKPAGTGWVDCQNQCQTEYDKCAQRNADALCRIQAISCIIACAAKQIPVTGSPMKNPQE